jgi:hypothetical protein
VASFIHACLLGGLNGRLAIACRFSHWELPGSPTRSGRRHLCDAAEVDTQTPASNMANPDFNSSVPSDAISGEASMEQLKFAIADQVLLLQDLGQAFDALETLLDPPSPNHEVLQSPERAQLGALLRLVRSTFDDRVNDLTQLTQVSRSAFDRFLNLVPDAPAMAGDELHKT